MIEKTEIEGLGSGLNLSIVYALKKYGRALPLAYLAKVVGQRPTEIETAIQELSQQGIVKRTDHEVRLMDAV